MGANGAECHQGTRLAHTAWPSVDIACFSSQCVFFQGGDSFAQIQQEDGRGFKRVVKNIVHLWLEASGFERVASLIGERDGVTVADIERALLEREQLQSTGIGEGVAIPHGALPQLSDQVAAL
ncbi:MAG: PTS sugar transporter subunit IIA, partial [Brachymonas sp.]|nr:PTS sugar transporter subunit IIA [Brachymonas sp.]